MALEVNGARGEVALTVGGVDLVIAATMEGLAATSTELNCKSISDLFDRLANVEAAATMAAIKCMTVRGDKEAALKALKITHFGACATAIIAALDHHMDGALTKKGTAAKE